MADTNTPVNKYLELVVDRTIEANDVITIKRDASIKIRHDGTMIVKRDDVVFGELVRQSQDGNVNRHNRPVHDYLDTEQKRLLRRSMVSGLSPEVRNQCRGLIVLVLTEDEHGIIVDALRDTADRKRENVRLRHKIV